jgi:hypothetical protein
MRTTISRTPRLALRSAMGSIALIAAVACAGPSPARGPARGERAEEHDARVSKPVTPGTQARDLTALPRAKADPSRSHPEGEVVSSNETSTTTSSSSETTTSSSSDTTVQQSEPVVPGVQTRDLRTLPRAEADPNQPHPEGGLP